MPGFKINLFKDSNQFEELHESGRDSNLICAGTQIIWYMVSKLLINMCRISNDSVSTGNIICAQIQINLLILLQELSVWVIHQK